jgi:hypothetical protein
MVSRLLSEFFHHELTVVDLFVVRDNVTRWNSSYASISRALLLKPRIVAFLIQYAEDLEEDLLTEEDWQQLEIIVEVLKPFHVITVHLEGRAEEGHHGSVWEVLPAIESLIEHLDTMKLKYPQCSHSEISISINLAWSKLDEYYKKLDDSPAYAAALILHPQYRLEYFKESWKKHLKKYLDPMKRSVRKLYNDSYLPIAKAQAQEAQEAQEALPSIESKEADFFTLYMERQLPSTTAIDEYSDYAEGRRITKPTSDLYTWWAAQGHLPSMQQFAYDHLSIPAMSAETERVFSDTKHIISDTRYRLGAGIIEALECQNRWIRAEI